MSLKSDIKKDMLKAAKEKDQRMVSTLRFLLSEIGKKEIEKRKRDEGLSDEEVQKVVQTELKKRREAAEQYEKGDREELAETEKEEAEIIQRYAPQELPESKIKELVNDTIEETGAAGMQDMGSVMKAVMEKTGNGADGSRVSEIVKKALQNG